MSDVNTNAVLAIVEALGITREQMAEAVGVKQVKARKTTAPEVTVLKGEQARKFGDVSVSKRKGETVIPKLGIFADDLPQFISDLQAALDELTTP